VGALDTSFKKPLNLRRSLKLKIGLHCGPVVAAFVGDVAQKFSVFGPTLTQV